MEFHLTSCFTPSQAPLEAERVECTGEWAGEAYCARPPPDQRSREGGVRVEEELVSTDSTETVTGKNG